MQDYILPLHIGILIFSVWNILKADHLGYLWMSGKKDILNEATIVRYHRNVWIGLAGMIVTGILMFWPMREYLLSRYQFFAKMAWVLVLVINGIAVGRLHKIATRSKFSDLSVRDRLPLLISGGISTVAWLSAIILAFSIVEDF